MRVLKRREVLDGTVACLVYRTEEFLLDFSRLPIPELCRVEIIAVEAARRAPAHHCFAGIGMAVGRARLGLEVEVMEFLFRLVVWKKSVLKPLRNVVISNVSGH